MKVKMRLPDGEGGEVVLLLIGRPTALCGVVCEEIAGLIARVAADNAKRAGALAAAADRPTMTDAEVAAQRESWVRGEMGMAEAARADGEETIRRVVAAGRRMDQPPRAHRAVPGVPEEGGGMISGKMRVMAERLIARTNAHITDYLNVDGYPPEALNVADLSCRHVRFCISDDGDWWIEAVVDGAGHSPKFRDFVAGSLGAEGFCPVFVCTGEAE